MRLPSANFRILFSASLGYVHGVGSDVLANAMEVVDTLRLKIGCTVDVDDPHDPLLVLPDLGDEWARLMAAQEFHTTWPTIGEAAEEGQVDRGFAHSIKAAGKHVRGCFAVPTHPGSSSHPCLYRGGDRPARLTLPKPLNYAAQVSMDVFGETMRKVREANEALRAVFESYHLIMTPTMPMGAFDAAGPPPSVSPTTGGCLPLFRYFFA